MNDRPLLGKSMAGGNVCFVSGNRQSVAPGKLATITEPLASLVAATFGLNMEKSAVPEPTTIADVGF